MARCDESNCHHCQLVERLLGLEGRVFENADLVNLSGLGNWTQPNDHSRRDNGCDWCTPVFFRGEWVLGPNKAPFQFKDHTMSCGCFLGPHHIFWSSARCKIDPITGKHKHSGKNKYRVVETLRWCNNTEA